MQGRRIRWIVAVLAVAVLTVAGIAVTVDRSAPPRSTAEPGAGSGGSLVEVPPDQLPAAADIAVIATVRSIGDVALSTPSGTLDVDPQAGPGQLVGTFTRHGRSDRG